MNFPSRGKKKSFSNSQQHERTVCGPEASSFYITLALLNTGPGLSSNLSVALWFSLMSTVKMYTLSSDCENSSARTSFYTWALRPSTVGGRGETLLWQQGDCNIFTVFKRQIVCGGGQMLFSQPDVSSAAALSNEVNTNWFTFNYPSVFFFSQLKSSAARRNTVMSESCRQPTMQRVFVCVCVCVCVCVLLEGLEIKIHDSDTLQRPSEHNMAAPSQKIHWCKDINTDTCAHSNHTRILFLSLVSLFFLFIFHASPVFQSLICRPLCLSLSPSLCLCMSLSLSLCLPLWWLPFRPTAG